MKVLVVSGFLGAGKTTFIRELARRIEGAVVVLENEFGEVGVDGDLLADVPIEVVELAQGCICCTMRTDFLRAVDEIERRFHPDVLLIEPTGVGSLSLILSSLSKGVGAGVSLVPPVTVVDAESFGDYIEVFGDFYRDQIAGAATLVVTKSEALPPEERDAVLRALADMNPKAGIVLPPYAELPSEWWDGLLGEEAADIPAPSEGVAALSLESLGLKDLSFRSREDLEALLDRLASGTLGRIYRVKGLAPVGGEWLRFDVVNRSRTIEAWRPADGSKMALIGEDLDIPGIGMALLEFRMPSAPETGASGAGEHGKIRIEKS